MKNISCSFRLRVFAAKSPITLIRKGFALSARAILVMSFALLGAAANTATASAQAVTFTGAGAVNFGTANVCPSGKTTPAPCNKTLTLTYDVIAGGTLGTPKALTSGAPNLDYKVAAGSTCIGSVTKGNTCTVNVTFSPTAPSQRKGAVEIVDGSGNVLATTYIYGSGIGPLAGFNPSAHATLATGYNTPFTYPNDIAVDGSGNVFVDDGGEIKEMLAVDGKVPANPAIKDLGSGSYWVAIDGAGNLFSGETEILAAGGYVKTRNIGGGIVGPGPLAVDVSGNVFVVEDDSSTGAVKEILAADGYTTVKTLGGGLQSSSSDFSDIALDSSGNVFVVDLQDPDGLGQYGYVDEIMAAGGYTTVRRIHVSSELLNTPYAAVVDSTGNLFVAYLIGNTATGSDIGEALAVDGVVPTIPTVRVVADEAGQFLGSANCLVLDGLGNLYVSYNNTIPGFYNNLVQELQISTPPKVHFQQTVLGHTSSDSPQSVQILNQGNAKLDLTGISLDSSNWDQVKGSGTPEDCTAGTALDSSALCNISISFGPKEAGPLNGSIAVTDNSLNAPGSQQSILLNGIGDAFPPPHINSLNWTYGAPYSVVILYGTNFGATQRSSTVTFNGIPTSHYYWADSMIYVTVPSNATSGNLVVNVGGEISNEPYFAVVPMPIITGISPTSGPAGTYVTISGQNLADYGTRGITVTLNGKSAFVVAQSTPNTTIGVYVPAGATTGDFHVLVNDTGINTPTFTVTK
jgi:hypothetical protein